MRQYLLAIDQGTTSSRAIVFDKSANIYGQQSIEIKQIFPKPNWVEHCPEDIWQTTLACCRQAIANSGLSFKEILAIGISNQRETTVLWDRKTGKPIYNAIVWQDRRTSDYCQQLITAGHNKLIQQKTGLLIDPYFSATKIHWLLQSNPDFVKWANNGDILFGTIDSFLIWRLTNGARHMTDATNAARTMLFNIHDQIWDQELLTLFDIPENILPTVLDSSADFGVTDKAIFECEIPISGVAGDQQAATVGQACFDPGMIKSTYGTGCFIMQNTGQQPVISQHRLLTTVAYRIDNKVTYALEGSIFIAGAAVQWLRDALQLIKRAADSEAMAVTVPDNGGVYLVPAFSGLGAPYWDPEARGAIFGLTRATRVEHVVRAALEAVCYQTRDLVTAMCADANIQLTTMRVDGGMVVNDWLMQFLADILDIRITRSMITETSALGAAFLAGLQKGLYTSLAEVASVWQQGQIYIPKLDSKQRESLYDGWLKAIKRVITE